MVFQSENPTGQALLMILIVKMQKTGKTTIFKSSQRRRKVPLNIFRGIEERKNEKIMFSMAKDRMKRKYSVFRSYKQRRCFYFLTTVDFIYCLF